MLTNVRSMKAAALAAIAVSGLTASVASADTTTLTLGQTTSTAHPGHERTRFLNCYNFTVAWAAKQGYGPGASDFIGHQMCDDLWGAH